MFHLLLLTLGLAQADPRDEAMEHLDQGRDRAAVAVLQQALAQGDDELRCLLAEVQHATGDEAGALVTLESLPDDAGCARQAAWLRAQALAALGDLDGAAAIYAELGQELLSDDRGAVSAQQLVAFADRILARDEPGLDQAAAVLNLALELDLSEERQLDLAREVMDLDPERRLAGWVAVDVVTRALGGPADRSGRLRLATYLAPQQGAELLASLPDDPQVVGARLRLRLGQPAIESMALVRRLAEGWPDDPATTRARYEVGLRLADEGWITEAQELLAPVARGYDERAAEAAWRLLRLEVDAGRNEPALALADDYVKRFPSSPRRAVAEKARLELLERAADEAEDDGRYDRAIELFETVVREVPRDPRAGQAAWRAALVARKQGDLQEATRRLDEVMARWPGSDAAEAALLARFRIQAIDLDQPEQAWAWVARRAEDDPKAASLLATLDDEELALQTPDDAVPGAPVAVRVLSRNVDQVQVRLHRIDPLAHLENGGQTSGLPLLDVEVIEPDAQWTARVPDPRPYRQQSWELPIDVPGPGLYAVSLSTEERTTRAVLHVSSTRLVTRSVGSELLVAVFTGELPQPGARIVVRGRDGKSEHVTDRTGLLRLTLPPDTVNILALGPGGPALLDEQWVGADVAEPQPVVSVDLDRPATLPGDSLGFRIATPPRDEPGTWTVWLEGSGGPTVRHAFAERADGTVTGELVVPLGWRGAADREDSPEWGWGRLMATPPWTREPMELARVHVAEDVPQPRRIGVEIAGTQAVIEVREADGRPVPDALVGWAWSGGRIQGTGRTDVAGRLVVEGPPEGVSWQVRAQLMGSSVKAQASREAASPEPIALVLSQERVRPGDGASVDVSGEGPIALLLCREQQSHTEWTRPDPWGLDFEERLAVLPEHDLDWPGPDPGMAACETVAEQTLDGAGRVELGALARGDYRVAAWDPVHGSALVSTRLRVEDAAVLGPLAAVGLGESVRATVVGGAALVTIEAGHDVFAAVLSPGQVLAAPVGSRWPDAVRVSAVHPSGSSHSRQVPVDNRPVVELAVTDVGPDWQVDARVLDRAGRPLAAQVVLRAVDPELERWSQRTRTLAEGPLASDETWEGRSSVFTGLWEAASSHPIAAALLQEARRQAERALAQRAAEGRLGDNALRDLLATDVPLTSGIGASGYGYGAGGFGGKGEGGIGRLGGEPIILGALDRRPEQGARQRALWAVLDTDARGRVQVRVPRPPGRSQWRVEAIAVVEGVVGRAEQQVRTDRRPVLLADSLAPAPAGSVAHPAAYLVNGTDERQEGVLRIDGQDRAVVVEAGDLLAVELGERRPGERVALRWESGGHREERTWSWPLDASYVEPGAGLVSVALGPGGGAPYEWLALQDDPLADRDRGHAAVQLRVALAALPHTEGEAHERVLRRAEALLGMLSTSGSDYERVGDRAQAIAALAEAARVFDLANDPAARLDGDIDVEEATAAERIQLLHARAIAGHAVPDATVARLLRARAELSAEERSQLARALVLLDRLPEARSLVTGDGPQAVLARRALGDTDAALTGVDLPPPGDPARLAWLLAQPEAPRRVRRGEVAVGVGDEVIGALDPARGGLVQASRDGALAWDGRGQPTIQRAAALSPDEAVWATRLPRRLGGLPVALQTAEADVACSPCRLDVGEAVLLDASVLRDLRIPGGLRRLPRSGSGQLAVLGAVPGRYVVRGRRRTAEGIEPWSLEIVVGEGQPSALSQAAALALWEEALLVEADTAPWRGDRSFAEDWAPGNRKRAARLGFAEAVAADSGVTQAFEDLRELTPDTPLAPRELAVTALAYAEEGRPDRAIDLWRRAVTDAFAAETLQLDLLDQLVGPLAEIQVLRDVALRYPRVPAVEATLADVPERLAELAEDGLYPELVDAGVGIVDVQLMAAAWNREFVLLNPRSPWVPLVGFRLAAGLHALGAHERAALWAATVREQWPGDPLTDRLLFVEGLALAADQEARGARQAMRHVSRDAFDQVDGSRRPSGLQDGADLALARLKEARGDLAEAARDYEQVDYDEARASLAVLGRRELSAEGFVKVGSRQKVRLQYRVAGAETLTLRAYRLDMRTLFLRDGGARGALDLDVAGIRPAWQGERALEDSPYPDQVDVDLPLSGPGVWLVLAEAAGQTAPVLVWRSDLSVDTADSGELRRVTVLRGGRPAAGVEVRAVVDSGQATVAAVTDARGVAMVPAFAPVIAWDDDDVDFTLASEWAKGSSQAGDELEEMLRDQLRQLRQEARSRPVDEGDERAWVSSL